MDSTPGITSIQSLRKVQCCACPRHALRTTIGMTHDRRMSVYANSHMAIIYWRNLKSCINATQLLFGEHLNRYNTKTNGRARNGDCRFSFFLREMNTLMDSTYKEDNRFSIIRSLTKLQISVLYILLTYTALSSW